MQAATPWAGTYPSQTRRRAVQACLNCARRKTRCDEAKPKCSYCASQNIDCVYDDLPPPQPPRLEPNTKAILERIQLLEERLFSAPWPPQNTSPQFSSIAYLRGAGGLGSSPSETGLLSGLPAHLSLGTQAAVPHRAGSTHVYQLPIIQELLSRSNPIARTSAGEGRGLSPASIFLQELYSTKPAVLPAESWRIFRDMPPSELSGSSAYFSNLVNSYFQCVNPFFPVLQKDQSLRTLDDVFASETQIHMGTATTITARYCLLLLVLCLGSYATCGQSKTCLSESEQQYPPGSAAKDSRLYPPLADGFWGKAELLLGPVSSELSLEAAQCCLLASIFLGARGEITKSFQWSHWASLKCEALAQMSISDAEVWNELGDSFRKLYWVAYIWEGDFNSEISIYGPSGLSKFEDLIPYPDFEAVSQQLDQDSATTTANELIAFQVSTNVSIRRCLNRVNTILFGSAEQQSRASEPNYVSWLLQTAGDLWTHHTAVYRNIPDFLLTSDLHDAAPQLRDNQALALPLFPKVNDSTALKNDPWNVTRLKGRYYAGQYIIHRKFLEFVLLNRTQSENHPHKAAILERCKACLDGCAGFINVFDFEPLNNVTCLFSAGVTTFTMTMLLIVATITPELRLILPPDVERGIFTGKRNIQRFSTSIRNFEWHLEILDRLDTARQSMGNA